MAKETMFAFIEKTANDEVFRAELIANPAEVLAHWDLDKEDLYSIKNDSAWAWLRDLWETPAGW